MPTQYYTNVRKPGKRFQRGYTCGHTYNARPIRTKIVPSNPLKSDPTRSKMLRKRFEREISERASELARLIVDLIVVEDAFGLKQTQNTERNNERDNGPSGSRSREDPPAAGRDSCGERSTRGGIKGTKRRHSNVGAIFNHNSVLPDNGCVRNSPGSSDIPHVLNQRFSFQTAPEQLISFERWLAEQQGVRFGDRADPYWEEFIQEGYEKGAGRAWDDTNRARRALAQTTEDIEFLRGSKEQFLRDAFAQPETREKISLLASRTFGDLRAVDGQLAALLNRTLAAGLAEGMNPRVIARTMLEGIGLNRDRAQVIARTEIIRAHAEGQLDAMERMGVERVGVMVEWSTAGDDRVCPLCQPLDGVVMKISEARGLIPRHPQCFVDATVPITTETGGKHIGQIREGDYVLTHKGRVRRVMRTFRMDNVTCNVVTLKLKHLTPYGNLTTLVLTHEHPVCAGDKWAEAGCLAAGDHVFMMGWEGHLYESVVMETTTELRHHQALYNFSVDEDESYVANGVVVHNCRCAHVPAQVGEPADITRRVNFGEGQVLIRQRKSKAEIEAAFRRSVGAERKKGTLKQKRRRSTWQGADRIGRIAKKRPKRAIHPAS